MKRKRNATRKEVGAASRTAWLGRWFRKRARPLKMTKHERQMQALLAANRRAFGMLAFSAAVAACLFWMALSVRPTASPQEMVKAQMVHGMPANRSAGAKAETAQRPSLAGSNRDGTGSQKSLAQLLEPREKKKYQAIGFDTLSAFPFMVTKEMLTSTNDFSVWSTNTLYQIPDRVKALDDHGVALSGFMLPMKYEGRFTTEFLLLKDRSLCCYGAVPRITEWVNVQMGGRGVKPILDQPVTVCGTLHVGDVRQNGDLVGIYRLEADEMKDPGQ